MMAVPITASPYATPTSATDPLVGITRLMDALQSATFAVLLGSLALLAAGICFMIWRGVQPEMIGTAVLGVAGSAAVIFGLSQIVNAYSIVDDATSGFLGRLVSILVGLLPLLLAVGIVVALSKMVGGRL